MTKTKKQLDSNLEQLASELHGIYQSEVHRQEVMEPKWPDNYDELPENMKDLNRAFAKYMMAMMRVERLKERTIATTVCRQEGSPELAEKIESHPLR